MLGSKKLLALPLAGVAMAAGLGASAFGASAPSTDTITIRSGIQVDPGHWVKDNLRYSPYATKVKSGGKVVIKGDKGAFSEGPHTFSLVRKKDLPLTGKAVNNCKVCGKLGQEHGVDPNSEGPPAHPVVDGGDGFNKVYDSVVFEKAPVSLKITAKKGATLYYMCAIHPWMQGTIVVK